MGKRSIVHVDFSANTPKESAEFYTTVFGWEHNTNEEFSYTMFESANGGGGFIQTGENDVKEGDIVVFIGSEDIEADLQAIEGCGGKRLTDVMPISGFGEMAYFTDPGGNKIGLWKSAKN